ncbi:Ctr copper transporter [Penicillium concentricum]|uniref:Copper transport protein n=1 Tax=Penicillium concentricum TaxID=293559 RepID=A0A9W9S966_9EURO|nr:Ctr copper transporter [Penicillium concentricum]KAJ5372934.1 Ctr copper transporter [Penicillium concentricum]
MEGMDMGSTHSMSSSSSMSMSMVFKNTHDTPLFSNTWTPSSSGSFAGTCIFLIVLAIIDRCLIAFKATMERHWLATHLNRRYVTVAGKSTEAGNIDSDPDAKIASLITAQGVEESVKVVHNITHGPTPWRFSVDLPRALLFLCIVGISYLLMLAVMTMNIGYFCSVLGGAFLGELAVGRFIQTNEHGH